ncbi:KLH38 protein, partial [Atractosteus spatula]|nr:KLH38 protein [Atractosteus spatula]
MENMMPEAFHFKDKEHPSNLLSQLDGLRQERILTDVLLCTGDREIPCHRIVLVSGSPYFRAMFCGDFKESQQAKISMRGIASDVLSSIIDYVYTGCIAITMELVLPVYHISRNMWSRLETRMVKNVCAPAAVIEDKIYIIGGYTRRVVAYDIKTNKFVKCAQMRERRMHHGATVIDSKLYVTGGRYINNHNVIEDSDCFESYDPKTDLWTTKGTLPYKLFDHGSLPLICVTNKGDPP